MCFLGRIITILGFCFAEIGETMCGKMEFLPFFYNSKRVALPIRTCADAHKDTFLWPSTHVLIGIGTRPYFNIFVRVLELLLFERVIRAFLKSLKNAFERRSF